MLCSPVVCIGPLIHPPVNLGDNSHEGFSIVSRGDRRGSELPSSHTLHYWLPSFFLVFLPGGVFLGNLGGDVPPGSQNSNPISDQKISLSTLIFRPGLQKPDPFSDLKLLRFV